MAFKSSPFGTQSHGYESNNSFLLWAYGKRLLIRSGYRDIYGSAHHQNWMWSTRSVNNITINGQDQMKHTARAQGRITAFETTPALDVVIGDATDSYAEGVELFKRAIIFVKPDLIIVYDRLKTSK
ncbi:MAG: heparinase II/III domain-containing protein, partial [Planctomycetota bacterium]